MEIWKLFSQCSQAWASQPKAELDTEIGAEPKAKTNAEMGVEQKAEQKSELSNKLSC